MANWFVSSAAYAAIPAFVASHAYSIGDIVKPTAPALKARWALRCTTAGTSGTEPTWPTADNGTVTTGGATFTNVTGQSAYGWGAAAGDVPTMLGAVGAARFAAGDRLFVSSDHTETQTVNTTYGSGAGGANYLSGQILSVNRAGSVPPGAADLLPGATLTVGTGGITMFLEGQFPVYHYGISYVYTGTGSASIVFNSAGSKSHYFDACQLSLNTSDVTCRIQAGNSATVILNNSTIRFGSTSQSIITASTAHQNLEVIWLNTPSAIPGATIPATLFSAGLFNSILATLRGVDLSAITGNLVSNGTPGSKYLFDSCRIASGVTRLNLSSIANTRDLVELINCYDGTNIINESYQPAGSVVTERTITLSGGATDDVGTFSHRLVSNTNIDKYVNPLLGFWMDVENTAVGAARTATVEIISSLTLNNDDISLLLEYQGTSGSPVASFGNSLPTVLTAAAAITTSISIWNSSPATPVKQKLVVTFTPQLAGRVRGQVRLGRASTTVYINPLITIA